MSTAVAQKPRAWFGSDNAPSMTFKGHAVESFSDGTALVKAVEVFKAGTFRDSWGDQHTWLPEHLMQMAQNFDMLRSNGIFPDVPARRDHSSSIDKVMGYVEALTTDGLKLFADIHVTEPTDVEKLVRGTYRARSLEVGMYVTNDEAMFWPVVFGVAYVDLPAVEGLHSKSKEISYFSQIPQGEGNMGTQNGNGTAIDDRPPQTVINLNGLGGQLNHGAPGASGAPGAPGASNTPAGPAPAPSPTPAPSPAPAPSSTSTFRINGGDTADFGAVQRHIDTLEGVIKTVNDDARKSFVSDLAKANKIVAAQVDSMQAFALSLAPDAYDAWRKTYEAAQPLALLANHGGAGGDPNAGAPGADAAAEERSVLEETVQYLHRVMPREKVEKTEAFRKLTALNANKS